jgi:hypothetical protein
LVIGAGGYSKCFIWDTYQTFGIQVHKWPLPFHEFLLISQSFLYFKSNGNKTYHIVGTVH